jgi:hypothetical protein
MTSYRVLWDLPRAYLLEGDCHWMGAFEGGKLCGCRPHRVLASISTDKPGITSQISIALVRAMDKRAKGPKGDGCRSGSGWKETPVLGSPQCATSKRATEEIPVIPLWRVGLV